MVGEIWGILNTAVVQIQTSQPDMNEDDAWNLVVDKYVDLINTQNNNKYFIDKKQVFTEKSLGDWIEEAQASMTDRDIKNILNDAEDLHNYFKYDPRSVPPPNPSRRTGSRGARRCICTL